MEGSLQAGLMFPTAAMMIAITTIMVPVMAIAMPAIGRARTQHQRRSGGDDKKDLFHILSAFFPGYVFTPKKALADSTQLAYRVRRFSPRR